MKYAYTSVGITSRFRKSPVVHNDVAVFQNSYIIKLVLNTVLVGAYCLDWLNA